MLSWSTDQKLVSLAVTGLLALQTTQLPASAKPSDEPTAKQTDSKSVSPTALAPSDSATKNEDTPAVAEEIAPETWESLTASAQGRKAANDFRGAEKLFNQSYELAKTFASDDSRKPQAAENLAELFEQDARYDSAQAMYQEAFDLRQSAYGEGSSRLSRSYYNVGRVQMLAGEYSKARKNLKKALDLRQFSSSEEANQQDLPLIYMLFNLGVLETETGDFQKAEEHLNRAQSIAQHLAKHEENAKIFSQLALLSLAEGDFPKAETQAQTSLSMAEKFAKGDALVKTQALDSVAMVQLARGKYSEAADTCEQSLALKRSELGLRHPSTANSLLTAGLIKLAEKKYDEAEKLFNDAIADQSISQSHLNYSRALFGRAIAHLKQKHKSESAKDLEQALLVMTSSTSADSPLPANYKELYTAQQGPNFNILEIIKDKNKSPNAVASSELDLFGKLLKVAVDDGKSKEVFAGMKFNDLIAVLGLGFIVIVLIAMAVLIPGAFSRLFPWGRDAGDHATMRNRNRRKQESGQPNFGPPEQQKKKSELRASTETERRQVQVWKDRVKTMEKQVPHSNVKSSGAYDRIDFKPSSQESPPISIQQSLSTPVQPEGSNDQYW